MLARRYAADALRGAVMSLRAPLFYCLPDETARVARAAFPRGNPYLRMYDALGPLFSSPDFADLYPEDGQPAEDPAQLALVTIDRLPGRTCAPGVARGARVPAAPPPTAARGSPSRLSPGCPSSHCIVGPAIKFWAEDDAARQHGSRSLVNTSG